MRAAEILDKWDGGARHFALRPPAAGQGVVVLVQSEDLRVVGAADLPAA